MFTVETMMPHLEGKVSGGVCKNLFLKDKKKKGLWLFTARHDVDVKLNDLGKKVSNKVCPLLYVCVSQTSHSTNEIVKSNSRQGKHREFKHFERIQRNTGNSISRK